VSALNTAIEMECLGKWLHSRQLCTLFVYCTGSHTVEQIKKDLWSFMRLENVSTISCYMICGYY